MRNLSPDIWEDEWFGMQDETCMLLWIGLLTKVCDDQGRFLDNPSLIKSKLFPLKETPTAADISNTIAFFTADEKLISYQAEGKHYLQFANWWKYQASSQWMGASKYPAPEGWQDCFNYHGNQNTLITSPNWKDRAGGYTKIPTNLPAKIATKIATNLAYELPYDVKDDVKDKEEGEEEIKPITTTTTTATALASFNQNASHAEAERVLCGASGLPAIPTDAVKYLDTVTGLITEYGLQPVKDALLKSKIRWCQTPRKTGGGTYSVLNFAWVDWAMALLSGQEQAEIVQPERMGIYVATD